MTKTVYIDVYRNNYDQDIKTDVKMSPKIWQTITKTVHPLQSHLSNYVSALTQVKHYFCNIYQLIQKLLWSKRWEKLCIIQQMWKEAQYSPSCWEFINASIKELLKQGGVIFKSELLVSKSCCAPTTCQVLKWKRFFSWNIHCCHERHC